MRKVVDPELALRLGLGKDWVGAVIDDETHEVLAYVDTEGMNWPGFLKRPAELTLYEALGADPDNDPEYWIYAVDKDALRMTLEYLYGGKGYMYAPVQIPDDLDEVIVDVPDAAEIPF